MLLITVILFSLKILIISFKILPSPFLKALYSLLKYDKDLKLKSLTESSGLLTFPARIIFLQLYFFKINKALSNWVILMLYELV